MSHEAASPNLKDPNLQYIANKLKDYQRLLAIAKEIADDPQCNLVHSERRMRLYHAIYSLDSTWPNVPKPVYRCHHCGADLGWDRPSGICSEKCLRAFQDLAS